MTKSASRLRISKPIVQTLLHLNHILFCIQNPKYIIAIKTLFYSKTGLYLIKQFIRYNFSLLTRENAGTGPVGAWDCPGARGCTGMGGEGPGCRGAGMRRVHGDAWGGAGARGGTGMREGASEAYKIPLLGFFYILLIRVKV